MPASVSVNVQDNPVVLSMKVPLRAAVSVATKPAVVVRSEPETVPMLYSETSNAARAKRLSLVSSSTASAEVLLPDSVNDPV